MFIYFWPHFIMKLNWIYLCIYEYVLSINFPEFSTGFAGISLDIECNVYIHTYYLLVYSFWFVLLGQVYLNLEKSASWENWALTISLMAFTFYKNIFLTVKKLLKCWKRFSFHHVPLHVLMFVIFQSLINKAEKTWIQNNPGILE